MIRLPDIAITSYLGDTPEKRKLRLDYHIRQREALRSSFPDLNIWTLASDYSNKEKGLFYAASQKLRQNWQIVLYEPRLHKWQMQNMLLRKLYVEDDLKAILFLDDDVIPRPLKPGEAEAGLVDTANLIRSWCKDPSQVGGQIAYFATAGLRFDAFWKSSKFIVGPAPPTVVSWAMFIRSDLKVLYTRDLVEDEKTGLYDDLPFRIKCWAEGKQVIKHTRAFWKSFQPTAEDKQATHSSWFNSQEERRKTNEVIKAKMMKMFPDFFKRGRKKQSKVKGFEEFMP